MKVMNNPNINIKQKLKNSETVTQVGIQNNYTGLSPEEACKLATNLFLENFPKLQEEASKIIKERVDELMFKVVENIHKKNIKDLSSFKDPDVQYILIEAQKNYARFNNSIDLLAELIVNRIECNDDDTILKIATDNAIKIVPFLSQKELNYLSLLFLLKEVKFPDINSIEKLKEHFELLNSTFPNVSKSSQNYLVSLSCLQIGLIDITEIHSSSYNLVLNDVKKIIPDTFKELNGDYITTHIGKIIAMINAEKLMNTTFDKKIWIHS